MKKYIHRFIYWLVKKDWRWAIISPFVRLTSWFSVHRNNVLEKRKGPDRHPKLEMICKSSIVKHGVFKGLVYPDFTSYGSAIFPKIIGCYEKEIEEIIADVCKKKYTTIIDVGCAEGYYAVGLARKIPEAIVYAYDIEKGAREYCSQLAALNNVLDRVVVRESMSAKELAQFTFTGPGLIICDCEGFEKFLFTSENINNLLHCDLIIELHDIIDITISPYIISLFKETHQIQIIRSIDDIKKVREYNYPELMGLDLNTKKQLVMEGRPGIMEWAILKAKSDVE